MHRREVSILIAEFETSKDLLEALRKILGTAQGLRTWFFYPDIPDQKAACAIAKAQGELL